jgi:hypothetical protein
MEEFPDNNPEMPKILAHLSEDEVYEATYGKYTNEQHEAKGLSQKIARILGELGNDYGFDLETVQEIAGLPFEEAFEMAYSYLMQAGLDADTILAQFTE